MVRIARDLEDLIPGYLANVRRYCAEAAGHVQAGDFPSLARVGHNLKGSGGGYGLDALTGFGHDLETAARAQLAENVNTTIRAILDFLDRLQIEYQD